MNLHLLNIPDNAEALAPWLEKQLLNGNLAELIAELAALRLETAKPAPLLDEALQGATEEVLQHGLAHLPPHALYTLLRQPALLLALQERVLVEGGAHWRRSIDSRWGEAAAQGRERLTRWLVAAADEQSKVAPLQPARQRENAPPRGSRRVGQDDDTPVWRRMALSCLASAACALVALFALDWYRGAANLERVRSSSAESARATWGWMDQAVFQGSETGPEHLRRLAEAAEQWFHHRPEDVSGVARRIGEFRQGCSQLLLAEHPALSPEDRVWLRERCRAWAGRLDDDLQSLEAGADALQVRSESDATIRRLIAALHNRAQEREQTTKALG